MGRDGSLLSLDFQSRQEGKLGSYSYHHSLLSLWETDGNNEGWFLHSHRLPSQAKACDGKHDGKLAWGKRRLLSTVKLKKQRRSIILTNRDCLLACWKQIAIFKASFND